MTSRLRKVEHIMVFDMEGAMVAGKKEDPFSYIYQKEYYLGDKILGQKRYNSRANKIRMPKNQFLSLKKRVNKLLDKTFCYVDEDYNVDIVIKGGSTITYNGENKQYFLEKVLDIKKGA